MRTRYHQHKLDEAEAKSFFVMQAKAAELEQRRQEQQHRQATIRAKVASRENELADYRNQQVWVVLSAAVRHCHSCVGVRALSVPLSYHECPQEEAYEAKRIKAEMVAEEKRAMQESMTARRVVLAKEEQRYTSAISSMRSSQRCALALHALAPCQARFRWVVGRQLLRISHSMHSCSRAFTHGVYHGNWTMF